ncbi:Mbeg1-like protein [Treponema sp.]|uniref:Mbeg1-like protein n=1 Tax=Treponema sp. TaxID=166 RepID=UPI00388E1A94
MSDLLDYIEWRGDISFESSPINEIDALIFCQLSYIDYNSVVSSDFSNKIQLKELPKKFSLLPDADKRKTQGAFINTKTWTLLEKAASCQRFRDIDLSAFIDRYIPEKTEQFSAITFSTDSLSFVALRGTDDTMVGWNEDFNLACMEKVPAQEDALDYLEKIASSTRNSLFVGGHSKGGNLAIYAAAKASRETKDRIVAVYNNDGPGFSPEFLQTQEFKAIEDKINSFVPELSIVGMLFSHGDDYKTVKSTEKGLMQHDPFSWQIYGPRFTYAEDTNSESKYIEKTVNGWIDRLNMDQKKVFVKSIFGFLRDTGIKTNTQLSSMSHDEIFTLIKNLSEADRTTRKVLFESIKLLAKTAVEGIHS